MLHPISANKPGQSGMVGAGGPAPGIRSAARTAVTSDEPASVRPNRDGSVSFGVGERIGARIVTSQQTPTPETPLRTRSEQLRGGYVDAEA